MQTSSKQLPVHSLSFDNTEIAFQSKSRGDLRRSYWLFKIIGFNWLVKAGPALVNAAFALRLPIKGIIKATVFRQFCGGESMNDCEATMQHLYAYGIGSILDYSVEGKEAEEEFEHTTEEIILTIHKAAGNAQIPFCVFKTTGLARFDLLAKVNSRQPLSHDEQQEFDRVKKRIERICRMAFDKRVRIFIDAEESWIQDAIDELCRDMMIQFNQTEAIVYNTIQLYRHDRLQFLKNSHQDAIKHSYKLGVKLVRGAYMEKERKRATELGYPSPIQPDKIASDRDYDEALRYCVTHMDCIRICAGTHNESSSMLLANLMHEHHIQPSDQRIYFSQLFGMSDHISYNLSHAGYNVAKYLPYGPVKAVLPYLFRRAAEKTSVKGQAGRELTLLNYEVNRRKGL
ncbi:MAG: proline dehydrogenase family protein [Bacteroidota bacterium]